MRSEPSSLYYFLTNIIMKKNNYTFEVHTFAPELNKVFLNGTDVSKKFESILRDLSKNYDANLSLLRRHNTPMVHLPIWQIVVKHSVSAHKCCDKTYTGKVSSIKKLNDFVANRKKYHNLSDAKITVSVKY